MPDRLGRAFFRPDNLTERELNRFGFAKRGRGAALQISIFK